MSQQRSIPQPQFLPMSRKEMEVLGWDALDILLVSGDAYVDHPAFGTALIGRWLVAHGYRVGVIAQPRWDTITDVSCMGRPRLFVGVGAGALDSMLAHYTAFRKKRHDDAYTPGGRMGARPNRACIQYTSTVRNAFPEVPVVLGGIEASLRRASHYDFWTDRLRRSILLDSKADLVAYGMAERTILDVARRAEGRVSALVELDKRPRRMDQPSPGAVRRSMLAGIPGAAWIGSGHADTPDSAEVQVLPSHEEILSNPRLLMTATLTMEQVLHQGQAWMVQSCDNRPVIFAPPGEPLSTAELDQLYSLPFTRRAHPSYGQPIPAVEMIQFSVTTHRGCPGGCAFCSLALHQRRQVRSRSRGSVLDEVQSFSKHPDFRGTVTDVGGPTANVWGATCIAEADRCKRASCLTPQVCANLRVDQSAIIELLDAIARLPHVKSVRVASGVRHDLALGDSDYVKTLVTRYVGGQLKLAPEHSVDFVLRLMRKPSFAAFENFLTLFERLSGHAGKEQYVIPYLISALPGCTDDDMRALARWLDMHHWKPRQVQCFIPTPGTVATAMYFTGMDPEGNPVHVARTDAQRLRQHRILVPGERSRKATRPQRSPQTES